MRVPFVIRNGSGKFETGMSALNAGGAAGAGQSAPVFSVGYTSGGSPVVLPPALLPLPALVLPALFPLPAFPPLLPPADEPLLPAALPAPPALLPPYAAGAPAVEFEPPFVLPPADV